jgi:hypothetical protein
MDDGPVLVTALPASTANEAVVPKFTWGWDAEAASVPPTAIRITVVPTTPSTAEATWRRRRITGASPVTAEPWEPCADPATFSSFAEVKRVTRLEHVQNSNDTGESKKELTPCALNSETSALATPWSVQASASRTREASHQSL